MIFDTLTTPMEISKEQEKKQEWHMVGRFRVRKGHSFFSYNLITGEIRKEEPEVSNDVSFVTKEPLREPRLNVGGEMIYGQALNKKNFIKALQRNGIL